MKKVTIIDGIVLDNNCFISSEFDIDDFVGTKAIAIDGSSTMFVQAKGSMTKEVKIYSKNSGWISKETKDSIIASVSEDEIFVEFDDLSIESYYYNHSKIPVIFTPIYEGALWYNVEINLLKG